MRNLGPLVCWTALSLAACGVIDDPFPEDTKERVTVWPGDTVHGAIHMLDGSDMAHDYHSWDERVRRLPAGFEFETERTFRHFEGIDAEYELRIPDDAAPGRYRFKVVYEFYSTAPLREQVDVRFEVRVEER